MTTIPPDADGVIVKGISGRSENAYSADTDDLIKILAEGGVSVKYAYEDDNTRERLLLKGAVDWWGPIVVFTTNALANGAGSLLANAVWELVGERHNRKTTVHLDVGRIRDTDGETVWFHGEGSPKDVVDALRIWKGE
jgi:hypothetical protein